MINSSTKFYFDDKWSDDASLPPIKNVTMEGGLYNFSVIGEKSIIEDQIQGRDEPYLYNVDHKPLEFTINIAFENYETIDEVSKVIRWLYNPKTYKRLKFENMETNFFAIFVGSPEYYYVGRHDIGYKTYIGYITCKIRANAPYGYTDILTTTINTGDLETYPSFIVVNEANEEKIIKLVNVNNSSTFTYLMSNDETLEFNAYTKTLKSSIASKNPYLAWGKDYLIFNMGVNEVLINPTWQAIGQKGDTSYEAWDGDLIVNNSLCFADPDIGYGQDNDNTVYKCISEQNYGGQTITYSYRAPKYL